MIRRSMRTARHVLAAFAILGLLAPIAHSSVVSVHVLLDAAHEAHGHEADLEASLHGHGHDGATPSHSHSFIAPTPAAHLTPASAPTQALPVDLLAAAPSVQPPQNDPAAHWRDARSGPGRLPPSLLSPILRI